jgi:hypothetical protein
MIAFLIVTSSSLAFYLGLLAVLYRDSRKRRPATGHVYKVQAGSVAELGTVLTSDMTLLFPRRRQAIPVVVNFVENAGRVRAQLQASPNEQAKVITLPTLARGNKDLQCG